MDRIKEYILKSIERGDGLGSKVPFFTIEGKSEILGMSWEKSIKIANMFLVIITINIKI